MALNTRSEAAPCPLAVLERFLKMGSHSEGLKLFCRIQSTKKGRVLKEAPMLCSHTSEPVKEELKNERLDPILSSLHSLRSVLHLRQYLRYTVHLLLRP